LTPKAAVAPPARIYTRCGSEKETAVSRDRQSPEWRGGVLWALCDLTISPSIFLVLNPKPQLSANGADLSQPGASEASPRKGVPSFARAEGPDYGKEENDLINGLSVPLWAKFFDCANREMAVPGTLSSSENGRFMKNGVSPAGESAAPGTFNCGRPVRSHFRIAKIAAFFLLTLPESVLLF
jgi:hypothetical protein